MSDLERRVQRLDRILAVSRDLTSTVALEPLLKKIASTAAELTSSEGASILLWDGRSGELRFRAAAGDQAGSLANIPVPIKSSLAGAVFMSGEPLIVSDTQSDPRHYDPVGQKIQMKINSLVAVPMQIKERRIGVLEAVNKLNGQGFTTEDVETLVDLGAQAAVAIENARLVGALRTAYERLGELDRLKSDFIAIASHELRTPLSLILGYASLLRDQVDGAGSPQLDVVLRAAMRLKNLIETMLNLRYLETGELELSCEQFDLGADVREACIAYRALAEANNLRLSFRVPPQPLLIEADRDKVHVVLDNLLSNAVRFTPAGGTVQVSVSRQNDQIQVDVADTGVGIPQEELDRIFEPFEQVEDHMTRRHGGMGLGLPTVKGLVELHGGTVWVESVPNQGSHFVFALPVHPPAPKET